jgi:predicted nucleotidyltransferase
MEIMIDNVETLRLFGSYARGEQSESSDYDVLAVLNRSQIINENLKEQITALFEREISISWYSKERIELLFRMGHLFAWHLY